MCSKCGEETSIEELNNCLDCKGKYCSKCFFKCEHCSREQCINCSMKCSQCDSKKICDICNVKCTDCGAILCDDTILCNSKCRNCGKKFCSKCIALGSFCNNCDDQMCQNCGSLCSQKNCKTLMCDECYEDTFIPCNSCNSMFCKKHVKTCFQCGTPFCNHCIENEDFLLKENRIVCNGCKVECVDTSCSEQGTNLDFDFCGKDKLPFCKKKNHFDKHHKKEHPNFEKSFYYRKIKKYKRNR